MWSFWLVFCDCDFYSVCPLMDENKRLVEAFWWEELALGENGSCSGGGVQFTSVQLLSHVRLFVTPWTAEHQASLSITNARSLLKSSPSSWWCHPAISSFVVPFSSYLLSFQHQGLFQWVSSSHQVAKVLEFQLQHQSFQWIFRTDFL